MSAPDDDNVFKYQGGELNLRVYIKKSLVCQYYFHATGVDPIGREQQARTYS